MDSARPVFVALAEAGALAGAEDARRLRGAELLFAVDAEYCGEGARRVHAHCAADEQTNYACSYQGMAPFGALCRVSIDRAVGSAAGGVFCLPVTCRGVAHLSSFHGSLFAELVPYRPAWRMG